MVSKILILFISYAVDSFFKLIYYSLFLNKNIKNEKQIKIQIFKVKRFKIQLNHLS